ncbi:hypothetical protein GCM10023336_24940 [Streptomyces similanensis]|uniref:Uncharacterized protein n=1 Tax=Streptomyces similanensis TaxID=1274988 RepID=A0ABP9KBJ7_9ACTN
MGAPVVLGVVVGTVVTLIADRAWSSELLSRCLTFSIGYLLIGPVVALSRRYAERRDRQHRRDVEEARSERRE